jgi:hypothetical protein
LKTIKLLILNTRRYILWQDQAAAQEAADLAEDQEVEALAVDLAEADSAVAQEVAEDFTVAECTTGLIITTARYSSARDFTVTTMEEGALEMLLVQSY